MFYFDLFSVRNRYYFSIEYWKERKYLILKG